MAGLAKRTAIEAAQANKLKITQEQLERWHKVFPDDFERYFSDFHNGTWWPMAQEWVGKDFAVGGVLLYSDEVIIGKKCLCYPLYGTYGTGTCGTMIHRDILL